MGENVRYLMHKYNILSSDWSQNINILIEGLLHIGSETMDMVEFPG